MSSAAAIGGRYVVEDALGRGGMAAVYRVRDAKTGQRLALKRAWARDPVRARKRRALLEREFHTLAQLRHPRIIEVYDFGVDDDGPYYTMELLDGADLDKAGQLPWRKACALMCDIASSLAILHSRGLLHRDVSARNVRLTADGRAKLLDFGTMLSVGVVDDVVGTPPFMSPEVLQMQALDARADLYSLGALAYYTLTGRHAYPATRPSDLRDVWRSRPMPPQRINPEVPANLSALVLQLLALDRAARPQTAAEVMERLRAIADLPKEELPEISRAYLTTPSLVGRQKALVAVRTRMLSLVRGEGGVILVEGPPGSGRSRMLDACVFEAKLLGAYVARAAASDTVTEAWGVARRLCSQLFTLMPDQASAASRLARSVLEHVIEEAALVEPTNTGTMSVTFPERSVLLRELRDFLLALGGQQRLLLVVDDADRIDEPSAALLAAVADKSEGQSLMLVLAMGPEADPTHSGSHNLLRSIAHRVELEPLDLEQTASLMRSVFGDVPNVQLCAGRIHSIAQGSPRTSMELAQHMVDRGLARYEAGRWSLPVRLVENDLPKTLSDSLALRLNQLGPDARELAEALAVADGQPLSLTSYRHLTTHGDHQRIFVALQELVSAQVLIAAADEHRFSQRGFIPVLIENLAFTRGRALHGRMAEFLASVGGDVLRRSHHLFYAGREREALDLLCALDLQVRPPPLSLLELAVEYAETNAGSVTARTLHRLRMALLTQASLLLAAGSFERCLPPVLRQLEQDCGLAFYRELGALPADQRLPQALARQQERYLATPECDQVYGAGDAIRELARLTGATCSMAGSLLEPALLDRLPSLEPLLPLSPAVRVVAQMASATRDIVLGAHGRAIASYKAVLARIEEPDRAGMDSTQHLRTRLGIHYALALVEAASGLDYAEERAKILEGSRALRVAAWRVRSLLALNRGNVEAAQKSARRAELLRLQDEDLTHYAGTDAILEMCAFNQLGDLLGVKSALDAISSLGQSYPGWRAFVPWAQSCYRLVQGDVQSANEWIAPACAKLRPAVDPAWALSVVQHVRVLRELGATPAGLEQKQCYLDAMKKHDITAIEPPMLMEAALLDAQAGEFDRATERLDALIRDREAVGAGGLALGMCYEARARVAIWMQDRAGFERFAAQCATEFAKGQSPYLNVKYTRLMDEARQRSLVLPSQGPVPLALSLQPMALDSEGDALRGRILECTDASDRARCALTMLLQSTESYLGHLYGVQESGLSPLAGLPETRGAPELEGWLASWVMVERQRSEDGLTLGTITYSSEPPGLEGLTRTLDGDSLHPAALIYSDCDGRRFIASPLIAVSGPQRTLVAMIAVQITGVHLPNPPIALCTQLAALLLERGDVTGIKLAEVTED
jgi:tetratricopeptide (TPR) repeat protein/tRNA A-37 threonylcarbamoyl transferase component Bud32